MPKITSFVSGPATALALAKVKTGHRQHSAGAGCRRNGAHQPQHPRCPLFVSQYVAADTLWAIDSAGVACRA